MLGVRFYLKFIRIRKNTTNKERILVRHIAKICELNATNLVILSNDEPLR